MEDDRDYAGMYQIEPGVWAQRVHIYEDDAQMNDMKASMAAMKAEQTEIKALVQTLVNCIAGGALKVKLV